MNGQKIKTIKHLLLLIITSLFVSFDNGQTAVDFKNRGNKKAELKNYRGAILEYTKSIALDPQYAEAYYNRGYAKSQLKDYQWAIADFNQAIKFGSKLGSYIDWAFYERGNCKAQLKDFRGAKLDFSKAIELEPDFSEAYNYRGVVKIFLGEKNSGCLDLSKAGESGDLDAYKTIDRLCNS